MRQQTGVFNLHWAVGIFCAILGALILVAPHQFQTQDYIYLQNNLMIWGLSFLFAGLALISGPILDLPRALRILIHLSAGYLLIFMAYRFWETRHGLWSVNFVLLGLGTILAVVFDQDRSPQTRQGSLPDLLSIVLGTGAVASGLLMLVGPGLFLLPSYDLVRRSLDVFGVLFIVSGLFLLGVQLYGLHLSTSNPIRWAPYLAAAVIFLVFGEMVSRPTRQLNPLVYYGVFGLTLILIPFGFQRPGIPTVLRMRLSLILAFATAVPLILTVALVSNEQERLGRDQALAHQEGQAIAAAEGITGYINHYFAALQMLTHTEGITGMGPGTLNQMLDEFRNEYPEVKLVTWYNPADQIHARSIDNTFPPVSMELILQKVQQTNRSSVDVLWAPILQEPALLFGSPIEDANGGIRGIIVLGVPASYITEDFGKLFSGFDSTLLVVTEEGRVIADPNQQMMSQFMDLHEEPAVAAFLASENKVGTLRFSNEHGEQLAAFQGVPQTNWGVIVEQPAEVGLAEVYAGRELAFVVLLASMLISVAAGLLLATLLAAPLSSLTRAVRALANGDTTTPLPRSSLIEIQHLAEVFGSMRNSLYERTRERERALAELRNAKADLEERVQQRTGELQSANQQLQSELSERNRLTSYLENERATLRTVLENAPEGIMVVDEEARLLMCNPTANHILAREIQIGQTYDTYGVFALCYPDGSPYSPEDLPMVQAILRGKTTRNQEMDVHWPNGERHNLLMNAAPLIDRQGHRIGAVAVFQDITQHKQEEVERLQNQARIETQHRLSNNARKNA